MRDAARPVTLEAGLLRIGFRLWPVRIRGLGPAGCIPDGVMQTQQEGIGANPFELWAAGENDAPLAGTPNEGRCPVMAG